MRPLPTHPESRSSSCRFTRRLLACLVVLFLLSTSLFAEEPAARRTGKYPLVAGTWCEWEPKGIFVHVRQHQGKFVATCTYKDDDGVEVHWRAEGTVTEDGDITVNLVHTRPDGYKSQTRTAKLDSDGKSIRGHAAWDDGGHDFAWTLKEPSGASRSLDRHVFVPPKGKCLLVVGQDNKSIDDYVAATGQVPGGVMVYTGVHDFGNVADFDYLLRKYPRCAFQVGLYMVDSLDKVVRPASSTHEKRLENACVFLQAHLDKQLAAKGKNGLQYLQDLYDAITRKLVFTFYTIEEECEIGMTFELMNSRGKDLSVLELLKNYLMHWVSRNGVDGERGAMTELINKDWKDTYTNLGLCGGTEDQCLRVAWTLYCNHTPKNWAGYQGFKQDAYIPLRNFSPKTRTKDKTKEFITRFADGLAEVSRHYATITNPTNKNTLSRDELKWLTKIHHTGNIANFLPLIVAARIGCETGSIEKSDYLDLLMALECFAYRVFLFEGKRSNAGMSSFYGWAHEVFTLKCGLGGVTNKIHALVRYYASEESFIALCAEPSNWYSPQKRLLRYTLFEYELELLDTEGKGKAPLLAWEQLNDSTIEHILPQNPQEGSHWRAVWNDDDTKRYLHDIGNLVLTQNNSNYLMFDFDRKKGSPGVSPSYSNSDIRQERKVAAYADWTPAELRDRRDKLTQWITKRWKTLDTQTTLVEEIDDEEDTDASPTTPVSEPTQ